MITCPKCSKDNQDHYKFCLGCGSELPHGAPKPFAAPAPAPAPAPAVVPAADPFAAPPAAPVPVASPQMAAPVPIAHQAPEAQPAFGRVSAPPAAVGTSPCPQCGHQNSVGNLFCGACGFRLQAAPQRSAAPAPAPVASGTGVVLTALRADGSEAGTFALPAGTTTVGRDSGGIFAGDSYLSPRHATFTSNGPRVTVKDEASLNGVYKKLQRDTPVELKPNDVFRIGQEIVRFEPLTPSQPSADGVEQLGSPARGYVGRVALVIGRDVTGNAFPIPDTGIHLGRERGDVLFPEDGYVSGLHCRLTWENGLLMLTDLGSSNGTFVRISNETELRAGDVLLMGQQLFRVAM